MSQKRVCCVNVDGRYALRNVPKTDSGVYPLVAHVRRSTRFFSGGSKVTRKINQRGGGRDWERGYIEYGLANSTKVPMC